MHSRADFRERGENLGWTCCLESVEQSQARAKAITSHGAFGRANESEKKEENGEEKDEP